MSPNNEKGVALITVLVVLASMALLMAGVFSLVGDTTRSANKQVSYEANRSEASSGLGQVTSLVDRVVVPNADLSAPQGYGVQWNRADFGDYLRDEMSRNSAAGAPDPCTQSTPDIRYTANTLNDQMDVAICVRRISGGAIPGSGQGLVFARTSAGTADNQSMFEITVWVTRPDKEITAQYQGVVRGFH